MQNFVFPDEIKTKFMEANCFVKNASLLTFDILKIFKQRFAFTRNGVKATQLTLLVASSNSKLCTAFTGNWVDLFSWKGHNITHQQGCIAVKNLFEFSIKVKFFRTTAREVKDKFFWEKLNYNFPQLSK